MRAAVYSQRGPSSLISVREVPDPEPGPGQVRVRVAVSGVNPTDWKMRSAGEPLAWDYAVPHQDGAGTIDAVGTGVDPARVGQRVWFSYAAWRNRWGSAAEFSVMAAERAVPLPDNVSFVDAAAMPIPFVTAHRCLYADGPIDGLTVLVAGGAGAVGHAAIQLARLGGAQVITTVSGPEKAALAATAGPHAIVNYREGDTIQQVRSAAPAGVDRVIEVALTDNLALDLAVLNPFGSIVTYADQPDEPLIPVRRSMMANVNYRFMIMYLLTQSMLEPAYADITRHLEAGAISWLPQHRFTLEQTPEAQDAVQAGAVGKVLIDI